MSFECAGIVQILTESSVAGLWKTSDASVRTEIVYSATIMISATVVTVNAWSGANSIGWRRRVSGWRHEAKHSRLLPRGYRVGFNFVASFGKMHAAKRLSVRPPTLIQDLQALRFHQLLHALEQLALSLRMWAESCCAKPAKFSAESWRASARAKLYATTHARRSVLPPAEPIPRTVEHRKDHTFFGREMNSDLLLEMKHDLNLPGLQIRAGNG